jgi:hypothetical protein
VRRQRAPSRRVVKREGPRPLTVTFGDAYWALGTYWDFYYGFGLVISGFLLVQAVVLWQLALRAKADPVGVRPIIASFFVSFLVNTILVWKFFFVVPLVMAIAITICLGVAFVSARPTAVG